MTAHKKPGNMSFRFREDVKELLKELAESENRTVTGWLENRVLQEGAKLRERKAAR